MTPVLQDSSDPVMQQLYKREIEPNLDSLSRNATEDFRKMCADPKYTFLETVVYYKPLKSHNIIHCDAIEMARNKDGANHFHGSQKRKSLFELLELQVSMP
jgi:hypothetical protein